jgi:hypothetical protein
MGPLIPLMLATWVANSIIGAKKAGIQATSAKEMQQLQIDTQARLAKEQAEAQALLLKDVERRTRNDAKKQRRDMLAEKKMAESEAAAASSSAALRAMDIDAVARGRDALGGASNAMIQLAQKYGMI